MPKHVGLAINDGYTEKGFVAEVRGLHPAVRFEYRPFTQDQRGKLLRDNAKLPPDRADQQTAEVVSKKLRSWDLKDHEDKPVPVSAANLLRLKPALFAAVMGIVMGLTSNDEDPEAPIEEKQQTLLAELDAAEKQIPPGEAKADADAKN